MAMIAALPMYDRPETAAANDRFWGLIRENLGHGPKHLTRNRTVWEIWRDPGLVLAQTCSLPYRTTLHGKVTLIGTPDYGLPGCPSGYYQSVFVVKASDSRTKLKDYSKALFAYNEACSQSGWAAPMTHASKQGILFQNITPSGSHIESARMVAMGQADIAALDVLSWKMMLKYDRFSANLRVLARTKPTPALPFIARQNPDKDAIFSAIYKAIQDLTSADRQALSIIGIVDIPADTYLALATPYGPKT